MKKLNWLIVVLSMGAFGIAGHASTQARNSDSAKNIVIVHGAFADSSGWAKVAQILTTRGYNVTLVNNPTTSLADDVAATKVALAKQSGPVILVGHSYGGEVITQAGADDKVRALVYVAAYVPDEGESLETLLGLTAKLYPKAKAPPIIPAKEGFLMVDPSKFREFFAADVTATKAQAMANNQLPLGAQTLKEKITIAAWKNKPSYYIVTKEDRMIPSDFEKMMATRAKAKQFEMKSSHAVYVSHPEKVARVIEKAAFLK